MKKRILGIIGVLAVIIASLIVGKITQKEKVEVDAPPVISQQYDVETPADSEEKVEPRILSIVGRNYAYSLQEQRVKKGDPIRVIFEVKEGNHDFVLDEFNVRSKVIQPGDKDIIDFIADKTGEFTFYCSVGNHRELGMEGKLIVEE